MTVLTRRSFALICLWGAAGMALARDATILDGIYLVLDQEGDESVEVPFHGADHAELLYRVRLMPFEVDSAEATFDENRGAPIIKVTLHKSLREQFAQMTQKYSGYQFAIVVGGVVVIAPYLREAIKSGESVIGTHADLADATARAALLRKARAGG